MLSNSSSETCSIGDGRCVIPALLTRISIFSTFPSVSAIAVLTEALLETSTLMEKPSSFFAILSAFYIFISAIITFAPSLLKLEAIPAPNPEAPPVIIAVFPLSLITPPIREN